MHDPLPSFEHLTSMVTDIQPIDDQECAQRRERAQRLMAAAGLDAIYLEAGPSLRYFTGVRWGLSERLLAAVLPARGEPAYVCPGFEGERLAEQTGPEARILLWAEHESPYRLVAQLLRECAPSGGAVGVEEAVRFFVFDGIRREAPTLTLVSADPVTIPCRAYKSAAEIALMQRANDITAAAYRASIPHLRAGMAQSEFRDISVAAHRALGVEGAIWPVFGPSTAYPHGSINETQLREGDMIVMDGSCTVEGYWSISAAPLCTGSPPSVCAMSGRSSSGPSAPPLRPASSARRWRRSTRPRAALSRPPALGPTIACLACRIAPAMASASRCTSGITRCAATPRRWRRASALATSR